MELQEDTLNSTRAETDKVISIPQENASEKEKPVVVSDSSTSSKSSRGSSNESEEGDKTFAPPKIQIESSSSSSHSKNGGTRLESKNSETVASNSPRRMLSRKELSDQFSIRKLQVSVEEPTYLDNIWYTIIGLTAFLDFISNVLVDYMDQQNENYSEAEAEKKSLLSRIRRSHNLQIMEETFMASVLRFLDENSVFIGITFSLLYFVNSFVSAKRKRNRAIQMLDTNSVGRNAFQENLKIYRSANRNYALDVILQCLLLPLSFYLIIRYLLLGQAEIMDDLLDHDEKYHFNITGANGKQDEIYSFTAPVSNSAIVVILEYISVLFARLTGMALRARIKRITKKVAKRTAKFAIRNPRRFARKLKEFLAVVRWVKYLIPLIATGNKLRGNALDFLKKRRQQQEAAAARKLRLQMWNDKLKKIPRKELMSEAAIMVQRNFRRQQAKKSVIALQSIIDNAEYRAAQTVQKAFRKRLLDARRRLLKKREEFKKLKEKHNAQTMAGGKVQESTLSNEEVQRMYKLQRELVSKANEILNQKMLLRPNTKFSVTWKLFFVICVFFEISQLALSPMLKKYTNEKSGEVMSIEKALELNFVPTPVQELEQCGFLPPQCQGGGGNKEEKLDSSKGMKFFFSKMKNKLSRLNKKKKSVVSCPEVTDAEGKPWYCHERYEAIQGVWIATLKMLIRQFFNFLSIVCFFDVFITFFTGELDAANGRLIPKPFFTRWILPGILLQFLVNPKMATVSEHVWRLVKYAHHLGVIRVFRWTVVLFYPLLKTLVYNFTHQIWRPLVKSSNEDKIGE